MGNRNASEFTGSIEFTARLKTAAHRPESIALHVGSCRLMVRTGLKWNNESCVVIDAAFHAIANKHQNTSHDAGTNLDLRIVINLKRLDNGRQDVSLVTGYVKDVS